MWEKLRSVQRFLCKVMLLLDAHSCIPALTTSVKAVTLVLLAPATTWGADGPTSSSWLDILNVSAAAGEYNPGCHSSSTCKGNHRLLQDDPISDLPCVSLQIVPGFWECTGGETAIQVPYFLPSLSPSFLVPFLPSSLLHVVSLKLLLRSSRRNLCVRSYFHLTKYLGLLQARNSFLPPFNCLLLSPSNFRRSLQVEIISEQNNPQTYSLDQGHRSSEQEASTGHSIFDFFRREKRKKLCKSKLHCS